MAKGRHRKEPGVWLAIIIAVGIAGSALLVWFVFSYVPADNANPLDEVTTSTPAAPPPTYPGTTNGPERTTQGDVRSPEPLLPDATPTKTPKKPVRPSPTRSEPLPDSSSGY